jgi:hypothetical protein
MQLVLERKRASFSYIKVDLKFDLTNRCLISSAPIAIGKTYFSGEDMYMSAMKGKCLNIVNIYTDNLWAMGDKSIEVPNIPTPEPVVEKKSETEEMPKQALENEVVDASVEPKIELKENEEDVSQIEEKIDNLELKEDENKSVVDHEKILEDSFLCAIKFKQKEYKLPIIVSTFMKIMQTCW